MPINNNLEPVELPMPIRFGHKAKTDIKVLEDSLRVKLVDGPTEEQLLNYIPGYVNATWAEDTTEYERYSLEKKYESIVKMFKGKTLPSALETIRFTFLIDGMTLQEVTHIIRHRNASFSAVCTGDRFMYNDDVFVPEAIKNSHEFYERYKELAEKSKELYVDMVNSKEVSLMDARYAMPRSSSQAYYMSISYKDIIAFIKQRIDRAVQPKSDNIIAYQMWLEIVKQIPLLAALDIIDFNQPSWFFINTSRTGHSTNLYFPEDHNDKFEWNEEDFIYKKQREDLKGTNDTAISTFPEKLQYYLNEVEKIKQECLENHPYEEILRSYN